jgi:HEPN domain-containing protein
MKVETIEWIGKAEGDIRTSQREFSVNEHPNYDAVCFHAQQCAEKYLKALLVEKALPVPRTHDLEVLLSSIIGGIPRDYFTPKIRSYFIINGSRS